MKTQTGSYKGRPTITLNPGSEYPFRFGPAKARLIVDTIDEIRAFVAANQPASPDYHDMREEDRMAERCGV